MAKSTKWILRLQTRPVNEIYKANMLALNNKDQNLYNMISSLPENKNYQLYRDDNKTPYNLVFMDKGKAYYDLNDSLGGMEREVDSLNLKNARISVFFGMGLGYELMYFINNYAIFSKAEFFLVVEKDPYIFKKALEATDLTRFISMANLTFAVGYDITAFDSFYRDYINMSDHLRRLKSIKIIALNTPLVLYKEYYHSIAESLKTNALFVLSYYGNSPQDSLLGEKHMFMNVRNIVENPGINLLYNKFKGKPAIICASGPSLTREIPLLKMVKNKALILSAESTFAGLHAGGVHPHIMCTLERDDVPQRRFDKYEPKDLENTYLAAVPVVAPPMYETYAGPIINVYRDFNHFKWLPFDKGTLQIQKSSANMAFKLAHMLGCEPIILLGQDLCYDRETGKTHIAEHMFGDDNQFVKNTHQTEVLANDGVMVKTNEIWFDFLQGYNVDVEEYGKEVINCSERGARIERTKYMPFRDAAEKYLEEDFDSFNIIKETFNEQFTRDSINKDILELDKKLHIAERGLNDMIARCDEAVLIIEEYMEKFAEFAESFVIPSDKLKRVEEASKQIIKMKDELYAENEIFSALVMHVVQSYYINFEINLNEKLGEYDDYHAGCFYIVKVHDAFFKAMSVMIKLVKDEIDNAISIIREAKENYL